MRVCVNYIEENEDWLLANRMERSYQEEERQRAWEREEKLARGMTSKSKMQRKMSDKNEMKPGEENDGECSQKAGNSKKAGGDEMTNLAWQYWHQKSTLLPGESLPSLLETTEGRKISQVEETLTVASGQLEDVKVIEENCFTKMTVEHKEYKKTTEHTEPTEDAFVKKDLSNDKIGKIPRGTRTFTPRKDAAARLDKISYQERSAGRVMKKGKGTTNIISNVKKFTIITNKGNC